jgi:hypothetical protein
VWQAVTPEPHIEMSAEAGTEPSRVRKRAQHRGRQEFSVGAQIGEEWMVSCAGHMTSDRIDSLVSTGKALAPPRVHEKVSGRDADHRPSRWSPGSGIGDAASAFGRGVGKNSSGKPATRHAAKPPSSTATLRMPIQRASHHKRAACAQFPWS